MTSDADRRLLSLDLLDEGEWESWDEWSNRGVLRGSGPVGVSIPELFARWVAVCPDVVAVSFPGGSLTYRELDEASNRVAHLLVGWVLVRVVGWGCFSAGRWMRWWRFWGC